MHFQVLFFLIPQLERIFLNVLIFFLSSKKYCGLKNIMSQIPFFLKKLPKQIQQKSPQLTRI
jgi:hypothetical protein